MAVYAYTAIDQGHNASSGTLTADTPADGRRQLRLRGLRIVEFTPARTAPAWHLPRLRRTTKRRQERVAELVRHLAILLRTGVPLAESLDVLISQNTGKPQVVLRDVRERVAEGCSLAEAFQRHPTWFDQVLICAVQVGQISGAMHQALSELADFLEERQSLRAKLTGALIYPAVLMVLGIGVVIFLMTFVMPQLLNILLASGKPLPASTMFLKTISDVLLAYGWLIGMGVAAGLVCSTALLKTIRGQRFWHRLQLRLPLVGSLTAKAVVAQFAQMTVMLLRAGVPFVEAMGVVRRSIRNRVLADELEAIQAAVEAGSDIAPALRGSRVFPPLVIHLMAVGQEAGELPAMLEQLRTSYEKEVRLAIGKFTAALEPLLIVVLAAVIGFVIFATLMPILEATRVMG